MSSIKADNDGEGARGQPTEPLFPTQTGKMLSRVALERRLAKYLDIAAKGRPSLKRKKVTLHTLHHTAAMRLLRAGVDTSVIALWLGREQIETPHVYLHGIWSLKSAPWRKPRRPTRRQDATGRPTSFSLSSRRSDYADPIAAIPAPVAGFHPRSA